MKVYSLIISSFTVHVYNITIPVQVLQKLPVTVGSLKQGTMGKLIKQLSKQEHPGMCLDVN